MATPVVVTGLNALSVMIEAEQPQALQEIVITAITQPNHVKEFVEDTRSRPVGIADFAAFYQRLLDLRTLILRGDDSLAAIVISSTLATEWNG